MSDKTDNIIRNPDRNAKQQQTPFEPEYVRLGKEPIKMEKKQAPTLLTSKQETRDFASVDGVIFDENDNEVKVEPGHVIDNNDWVFPPDVPVKRVYDGTRPISKDGKVWEEATMSNRSVSQEKTTETKSTIQGQPQVGEYILLVFGKIVHTGKLNEVEGISRAILYGENEQFIGTEVKVDDIVVLKRVGINVGIFIDR